MREFTDILQSSLQNSGLEIDVRHDVEQGHSENTSASETVNSSPKEATTLHTHRRGYPLHAASSKGHLSSIRLLLERGANIDVVDEDGLTALHHAVLRSRPESMSFLISSGAAVNVVDHTGHTALCYAADQGRDDMLNILLNHGAVID